MLSHIYYINRIFMILMLFIFTEKNTNLEGFCYNYTAWVISLPAI